MTGFSFHAESGHVISPANSWKGKYKIPTRPGFAHFFPTLTAARKWAKKHPKDVKNPLGDIIAGLAGEP